MRRSCVALGIALAAGLALGCGGSDGPRVIGLRWRHDVRADAAPPGVGPDGRVLVATRSGQGEVTTLNAQNGVRIEGPLSPAFPTEHAPVFAGGGIVIVSSIGKVVSLSFAAETRFSKPDGAPLGLTSPIAIAPDGSLRIASTSGRLVALAAEDGRTIFEAALSGAASSPLAIDAEGTTYAATDLGDLVATDATGGRRFSVALHAPASGPSVAGGRVAVGEADGLRVLDASGAEIFRHPRAARVVGTRILETGEILAWGEDGAFEVLDASGSVLGRLDAGPPIYANAIPVGAGDFAVIDSAGTAYLVDRAGAPIAKTELGGAPRTEVAQAENGFVLVTVGETVHALDFAFE